eukprot:4446615-Prymnesium_polylepis.1
MVGHLRHHHQAQASAQNCAVFGVVLVEIGPSLSQDEPEPPSSQTEGVTASGSWPALSRTTLVSTGRGQR